jgi:hypothetical protein
LISGRTEAANVVIALVAYPVKGSNPDSLINPEMLYAIVLTAFEGKKKVKLRESNWPLLMLSKGLTISSWIFLNAAFAVAKPLSRASMRLGPVNWIVLGDAVV